MAQAANWLFNGAYPNESVNSSSRLQPQARFLLHHLCLISLKEKKSLLAKPTPKPFCIVTLFYYYPFPAASERVHHSRRGWPQSATVVLVFVATTESQD